MKSKILVSLLMAMFTVGITFAQTTKKRDCCKKRVNTEKEIQHRTERMAKFLKLSEAQKVKVAKLHQKQMKEQLKLREKRASEAKKRASEALKRKERCSAEMKKILTPEQYKEFQKLQKNRCKKVTGNKRMKCGKGTKGVTRCQVKCGNMNKCVVVIDQKMNCKGNGCAIVNGKKMNCKGSRCVIVNGKKMNCKGSRCVMVNGKKINHKGSRCVMVNGKKINHKGSRCVMVNGKRMNCKGKKCAKIETKKIKRTDSFKKED